MDNGFYGLRELVTNYASCAIFFLLLVWGFGCVVQMMSVVLVEK